MEGRIQLALLIFLLFVLCTLEAESTSKEVSSKSRVRRGIMCGIGLQPAPCVLDSDCSCESRPPGTFNDAHLRPGEACMIHMVCVNSHMVVEVSGTAERDTVCGCEPGYKLNTMVFLCYLDKVSSDVPSTSTVGTKSIPTEGHSHDPLNSSNHVTSGLILLITSMLPSLTASLVHLN